MINIKEWLDSATEKLHRNFNSRLLFIGLQGSYNRGEATLESDIDLVVILDELDFEDLKTYRLIIDSLPQKDRACGFISGKNEIQRWSKSDLFQFFYDTKPLFGRLEDIIKPPKREEIEQGIKSGFENIYHGAVHSFVHSDNYIEDLQNLYKMTFFVLQAKYFIQTNKYIKTKKELLNTLSGEDKEILKLCTRRKEFAKSFYDKTDILYQKLIDWCSKNIK